MTAAKTGPIAAVTLHLPQKPRLFQAYGGVHLFFDGYGLTPYIIQRSTSSSFSNWVQVGLSYSDWFTDTTAVSGSSYYYRISSSYGLSPVSQPITAQTFDLSVADQGGSVTLSWPTYGIGDLYTLWRAANDEEEFSPIYSGSGTSYSDTAVAPGGFYRYYVLSGGSWSNTAAITARDLTVSLVNAADGVHLNWEHFGPTRHYAIERSTSPSGGFTTRASDLTTTSFTDVDVSLGTTYYYRLSTTGAEASGNITRRNFLAPELTDDKPAVILSWQPYGSSGQYFIERAHGTGAFTPIGSTSGTEYRDSGTSPGNTYTYRIRRGTDLSESSTITPAGFGGPSLYDAGENGIGISWGRYGSGYYTVSREDGTTVYQGNETSCSDSTVGPNSTYRYRVTTSDGFTSDWGSIDYRIFGAPNIYEDGDSGLFVSWNAYGSGTYVVERSVNGSGFENVGVTSALTYIDHNVSSNHIYVYRIETDGYTSLDARLAFHLVVASPTELTAGVLGANQVSLAWLPPDDMIVSAYNIDYSTDGGQTFLPLASVPGNTTHYRAKTLTAMTQYTFRVTAANDAGESDEQDAPTAQATTTQDEWVDIDSITPPVFDGGDPLDKVQWFAGGRAFVDYGDYRIIWDGGAVNFDPYGWAATGYRFAAEPPDGRFTDQPIPGMDPLSYGVINFGDTAAQGEWYANPTYGNAPGTDGDKMGVYFWGGWGPALGGQVTWTLQERVPNFEVFGGGSVPEFYDLTPHEVTPAFIIHRNGRTSESVYVDLNFLGGSAKEDEDFSNVRYRSENQVEYSTVPVFEQGDGWLEVHLDIDEDAKMEGDEDIVLTLNDTDDYNLTPRFQSKLTITDDDHYDIELLTVQDPAFPNNSVTDTAEVPADRALFIEENAAHAATVELVASGFPADLKSRALWRVFRDTGGEERHGDFSDQNPPRVTVAPDDTRHFIAVAGIDDNGDGTLQDGEIDRTVDYYVVKVQEYTVLSESDSATATTPEPVDLYVPIGSDGTVSLSQAILTDPSAPEYMVWHVAGNAAIPAAGSFAVSTDVTLIPQGEDPTFTFEAGFDNNVNGLLEPSEVDRTILVHVTQLPIVWVEGTSDGSEDNRQDVVFTIHRNGSTSESLDIYYTLGGTATMGTGSYPDGIALDGADYTGPMPDENGLFKVTIPSGQSSVEVHFKPLNDPDDGVEGTETIELTLLDDQSPGGPFYAAPGTNPATKPGATTRAITPLVSWGAWQYIPDPNEPDHAVINAEILKLGGDDRVAAQEKLIQLGKEHPILRLYYEKKLADEVDGFNNAEVVARLQTIIAATPKPGFTGVVDGSLYTYRPELPEPLGPAWSWKATIVVGDSNALLLQVDEGEKANEVVIRVDSPEFAVPVKLIPLKSGNVVLTITVRLYQTVGGQTTEFPSGRETYQYTVTNSQLNP